MTATDKTPREAAMEKLLLELLKCRQVSHARRKIKEFLKLR